MLVLALWIMLYFMIGAVIYAIARIIVGVMVDFQKLTSNNLVFLEQDLQILTILFWPVMILVVLLSFACAAINRICAKISSMIANRLAKK